MPTSRSCSRSSASRGRGGPGALLDRRLVAWARSTGSSRAGRRPDAERVCCRVRAIGCAPSCAAPAASRASSTTGPSGTSATRCSCARFGALPERRAAGRRRVPRRARSDRGSLPDRRRRAAKRRRHPPIARTTISRTGCESGIGRRCSRSRRLWPTSSLAFNRDLNVVLARGVWRMFAVALAQYQQLLDERSVLDFSDVLDRALELLRRMDEFSQSRFGSRRAITTCSSTSSRTRAGAMGAGRAADRVLGRGRGRRRRAPSIFIVGDRKQSIYRFRDAEAAVLQEAARHPGASARRGTRAGPLRGASEPCRAARVRQRAVYRGGRPGAGGRALYHTESDRFPTTATTTATDTDYTGHTDQIRDRGHPRGRIARIAPPGQAARFELGIAAANDPVVRGSGSGRDREDSARGQRSRSRTACRGGPRRGISACCSGRAPAIASSSASSSGEAFRPTFTRAGLLRRRRDQGCDGA